MVRIIELSKQLGCQYLVDEPMKNHTTFKIGGNASLIVFPESEQQIAQLIKKCNECSIRYLVIGNGSNMLVSDNGIDACVISLGKNYSRVELIDETTIYAQTGASLTKVCRFALENNLSGMEFAFGIPGSCGGAAFMNAGAYGGEMKDCLFKCDHIAPNGEKGTLEGADLKLEYRHSAYYDNECAITGIYLKLEKANPTDIKAKMDDLLQRRKDKQPLEYPSAGSTFKRPEGYFAAALIEECGLKGKSVGGACVSTKHSGFVINTGGATCNDVLELCKIVSNTVMEKKGVKLDMEIRVTE